MKKAIKTVLILFALTGCIERYFPKTEGIGDILAVEGIITNGIAKITLTYSASLDESLYKMKYENLALVYVECDDGTKSTMTRSSGNGIYLIETGELNAGAKYRLVIQLDGEEFHSSYIAPAITPPVDVSFTHDPVNSKISIHLTTTGNANQPGYYVWSYKEDWEIYALKYELSWPIQYTDKNGNLVTGVFYNYLHSPENVYYCWKADSSKYLILGSTDKLSENTIRERELKNFNCASDRISVLYRIKVRQNTLNKEGYDYFENLRKNADQTGNLFGTIPSELMGNIRCVSNPGIPVIGYVDVSTISTNELYLTDKHYDSSNRDFQIKQCVGHMIEECRDCTYYGTKKKPKDWPNDHL